MRDRMPGDGVFVRDGWATARLHGIEERVFRLDWVAIRGAHNRENAVAATAVALACGVSPDAVVCAVESFRGVPHRLEFVAEAGGISYYNDSIATTPERSLAGIRSFNEPVVLLLGGRDKNLPLDDLAAEAVQRCRGVVLFGESAPMLQKAFEKAGAKTGTVVRVEGLTEAVGAARRLARPGDVILLSPACTSYDTYENFEARGEHFRALVSQFAREVRPSLP
jgi:UDP-N-acetylmuramoylalanine--D-glutamate ligase